MAVTATPASSTSECTICLWQTIQNQTIFEQILSSIALCLFFFNLGNLNLGHRSLLELRFILGSPREAFDALFDRSCSMMPMAMIGRICS
jgi:hypothetical protein